MLTRGRPRRWATPFAVSIALPPPMPTRKSGCSGASCAHRRSMAASVHAPPKGSAARSVMSVPAAAARSGGSAFSMAVSPPTTAKRRPIGRHSAGKRARTSRPMQKRGRATTSVVYMRYTSAGSLESRSSASFSVSSLRAKCRRMRWLTGSRKKLEPGTAATPTLWIIHSQNSMSLLP